MRRLALGLVLAASLARADIHFRNWEDPDAPKWQEEESSLPAYPQDKDLVEFYVGPLASSRFLVDAATLEVGNDGVVRYTLVVKTAGGATNVSREGIRCDTREYRLYASGRADGAWAKARSDNWRPFGNAERNRYHEALSKDLLCPNGAIIGSVEEGRKALRLGRNPSAAGAAIVP